MKAYIPSSLDLPTFQETPEKAAANWQNIEGYEEYTNGQFGISLNITTDNNHKISAATFGSFRDADDKSPRRKSASALPVESGVRFLARH
jgi:iron complex outermembrane receptor protein